jgi:hypothetical protein
MVSELLMIVIPVAWLTLTLVVLAVCRVAARADAISRDLSLAGPVHAGLFLEDAPAFHEVPAGLR